MVKNLLAIPETYIPFVGWEDALEKGLATHSSILDWSIPRDRAAWLAIVWAIINVVAKNWT